MFSWIGQQTEIQTSEWAEALRKFYPQYYRMWSEVDEHMDAHRNIWNLLDATEQLNWADILKGRDLRVLDLGCGTGWLSALVSRHESVSAIHALDSDKGLLEDILPGVVNALGGNLSKIECVHGLFSPLPVPDKHYDYIVSSSAVHHAPSLVGLFKELNRVLSDNGRLVLVNETPYTYESWIALLQKRLQEVSSRLETAAFKEHERTFSAMGILEDPYLGDIVYSDKHWEFAFMQAGFNYQMINTGLYTCKASFRPPTPDSIPLHHFLCHKSFAQLQETSEADQMLISSVNPHSCLPDKILENSISLVEKVSNGSIPGSYLVLGDCGGGSSMGVALTLIRAKKLNEEIIQFTPAGLPTEQSANLENALSQTSYSRDKLKVIASLADLPKSISFLQISTENLGSIAGSLKDLYPRIAAGGICLVHGGTGLSQAQAEVSQFFSQAGVNHAVVPLEDSAFFFEKGV